MRYDYQLDQLYSDIDDSFKTKEKDIIVETGVKAIENSIDNILGIRYYEVPGRPDFGSVLQHYLFEIIDDITLHDITLDIKEKLTKFEDRIIVTDVSIESYVQSQFIVVNIEYRIIHNEEIFQYRVVIE